MHEMVAKLGLHHFRILLTHRYNYQYIALHAYVANYDIYVRMIPHILLCLAARLTTVSLDTQHLSDHYSFEVASKL